MVLATVACLLHSTPALGDLYLNGGLVYFALPEGTGSNFGGANEFDSFNTGNSDLFFNGVTGSPFQLVDGLNSFSVTGHAPTAYGGLGLFFTTNNVLLSQQGLLPDLVVYTNNNLGFSFPNAGVQVATLGAFSGDASYTGAINFAIDNRIVTVTAWDRTTLQLQVSAVPEPCSWALALISGMGISLVRVRRRP
jgi:hypothetical protein